MSIFDNPYLTETVKSIIEKYEVDFVFQPIFSRVGTVFGYEALMRPKGKFVLDFIEEMKRDRLLHDLEILTFFGATYAYQQRGYDAILSINSFPTEIFTEEELVSYTKCFEMPREKVMVEILEYSDEKNWTWLSKSQQISRNSGVEVALDDFGTGYNDELAVEFYRPYMIKLDRSLVSDININVNKQDCVKRIIEDMHDRKILVLAEGIEKKEEYDYLMSNGVDFFQGYYLGRPA